MAEPTAGEDALDRLLALAFLLSADARRHLTALGLSESRAHLLLVLHGSGPVTQRALAGELDLAARTVTALVDALTDSGHVTREAHPNDRRAFLVTLTPHGASTAAALAEGRIELAQYLFADWSPRTVASFVNQLDRVLTSMQLALEPDGASGRT